MDELHGTPATSRPARGRPHSHLSLPLCFVIVLLHSTLVAAQVQSCTPCVSSSHPEGDTPPSSWRG